MIQIDARPVREGFEDDGVKDLDPTKAPSFYIKRIAQELTRLAELELRPLGSGMAGLPVLTALKNGDASTQAELARLLHVEQPSMAQTLARLERDGLINREAHPSKRRAQVIALTPMAHRVLPHCKRVLLKGNMLALSGFTAEERRFLLALLKRMHENLAKNADEL